jgi:hypothetical protein
MSSIHSSEHAENVTTMHYNVEFTLLRSPTTAYKMSSCLDRTIRRTLAIKVQYWPRYRFNLLAIIGLSSGVRLAFLQWNNGQDAGRTSTTSQCRQWTLAYPSAVHT